MQDALTITQTAAILGACTKTIRRWVKDGKLSGYMIGRRYRFRREDVEAFINRSRFEARVVQGVKQS